MQRILAVAFLMALGGCMTPTDDRSDNRSPNYQLGFGDGCNTASTESAGAPREPQRNRTQYEFDAQYRAGWISGHAQCKAPFPVSAFIRRT